MVAGRTNTFLGERYRRIARRRGKKRAIVAVGRSILVIIWHLLADEDTHFPDLGPDLHQTHQPERKKRNHIRQLEALGYTVTLADMGWVVDRAAHQCRAAQWAMSATAAPAGPAMADASIDDEPVIIR